jgi:hypothetical protein
MNKTKRVAWHKHLRKRKKREEKVKAARLAQAPTRQTTPRR